MLTVFAASASTLLPTSAGSALSGVLISQCVTPKVSFWTAGVGVIAIGL